MSRPSGHNRTRPRPSERARGRDASSVVPTSSSASSRASATAAASVTPSLGGFLSNSSTIFAGNGPDNAPAARVRHDGRYQQQQDDDCNNNDDDYTVATWIATSADTIMGRSRGRPGTKRLAVRRLAAHAVAIGALVSGTIEISTSLLSNTTLGTSSSISAVHSTSTTPKQSMYGAMQSMTKDGESFAASQGSAEAATRLYQLRQQLTTVSHPDTLAIGSITPQNAALTWLATIDQRRLALDDPHLTQRYVLATLYFATNANEWPTDDGWTTLVDQRATREDMGTANGNNGAVDTGAANPNSQLVPPQPPPGKGGWKKRHHFLSDLHECDWSEGGGVRSCDDKGYVTDLSLWNNLRGIIPSELGQLTQLKVLYLQRNNMVGTLPESLGNCVHLEYLGLAHNRISGTVPSHVFGNLLRLKTLSLEKNEIRGNIRRVDPLCQLKVDAKPPPNLPYLGGSLKALTADCQQIVSWKEPEVICGCCTKCYRA